jgi:hypothetical protein
MQDSKARLDPEHLRESLAKLKHMTQNCGEAIHITLAGVVTASPDENLRPHFLRDIMSVFKTQEGLMRGQEENVNKLARLCDEYITQHTAAAGSFT